MELVLQRLVVTPVSTAGTLSVDGGLECMTLELPVKQGLPGSAIPAGTYPVLLMHSPKFSRDAKFLALCNQLGVRPLLPELLNIPHRSEILIHWGNYAGDIVSTPEIEVSNTKGCILVGKSHRPDFIGESRKAFAELYAKLIEGVLQGISITVVDRPPNNGSSLRSP